MLSGKVNKLMVLNKILYTIINGLTISFTPNQKINYPLIKVGSPVTPFGPNSRELKVPDGIFTPKFRLIKY